MKKNQISYFVFFILIILVFNIGFLFLNASTVMALSLKNSALQLGAAGGSAGYSTEDNTGANIEYIIAQIIKGFLSFLGVIFLILIIYGGFKWMTAHGNEEQVTKAKNLITEATIGLIIVLSSYLITFYVITKFISAVFETGV